MYGAHPPKNSGEPVGDVIRHYQTWKGSNIFFLGGRFIFGPDIQSIFLSIFLTVAPVVVFCVFVGRKLLDEFNHHLGILVMVIAIVLMIYVLIMLLVTSGRDPGIIPRNTRPSEPDTVDQSIEVGSAQSPPLRLPRFKEVTVNGLTVKSTYENFRYRYDRTENPYNRGITENFKDVFWRSIPPSKNDFRALVVRESETLHPALGGGFVNSHVEKSPSDMETGDRKPAGNNRSGRVDQYDQTGHNDLQSSWGRRSGSWELPSDIASALGDSNRIVGGNSDNLGGQLRGQNRQ
ncbi:hypothetical protein L1987_66890 [Smallanthus sonchifolius]|uniref:Uncharacterized protein n=1 Tax=Smallanthus sonchifolius TaxID=185202 RepID=A0ACB9BYC8_9ASTR|nr:hypothetical protein L1987_66890 [Smallanthus sonchifolius]